MKHSQRHPALGSSEGLPIPYLPRVQPPKHLTDTRLPRPRGLAWFQVGGCGREQMGENHALTVLTFQWGETDNKQAQG